MNRRRLLNTSAMRIASRYAAVYAALMILGLGSLYWSSNQYIDEQIRTGLQQKMADLLRIDQELGRDKLIQTLKTQSAINKQSRPLFLLMSAEHKKILGDLDAWPPELHVANQVVNIWMADSKIGAISHGQDAYWPMIASTLSDGGQLLLAQSLKQAEELQEMIFYSIVAIFFLSVGMALTMGWFIGQKLLGRIDKITATANAISSGDLTQRVPVSPQQDEFDELANYLNRMLDRIVQLLTGMRQVTDNIAHDLRKPLSRLRNRLEVTLLKQREPGEYQQVLTESIKDTDELINTFNALLEIAQTEAGSFRGEWQSVDLSELLQQLGRLYLELAGSKGQQLTIAIQDGLKIAGNRHLLAQAISNLLDNAIKYTGTEGQIVLEATQQQDGIVIKISDNGQGIPVNMHTLVLERFFRLDSARSTPGNGLGLSLVKAVMDLHGVTLDFADNYPGLVVLIKFAKDETC